MLDDLVAAESTVAEQAGAEHEGGLARLSLTSNVTDRLANGHCAVVDLTDL